MMGLTAGALAQVARGRLVGADRALGAAVIDSREVSSGCTFFCLRGPRFDAHDFARAAVDAGAGTPVVRQPSHGHSPPLALHNLFRWRRTYPGRPCVRSVQ